MNDTSMDGLKNCNGRFMHAWELYPLLGIGRGCHLPAKGFEREVNGVRIICTDATPSNGNKSSRSRLFAQCSCGKPIPVGRLGQHMKGEAHRKDDNA